MADILDLDWFPFDLADGQSLVLEVNWGAGGYGRAETALYVYEEDGALVRQAPPDGSAWGSGGLGFDGDILWVGGEDDGDFHAEFTWIEDGSGLNLVDGAADAAAAGAAEGQSGEAEGSMFAGGSILVGGEIPMGDVLLGGDESDVYRITSASQGETVTILDFNPDAGSTTLDISDLLSSGADSLEVTYDSHTESTTLTLSGGGAETVIVIQGVDLTSNFDDYVITDTIL